MLSLSSLSTYAQGISLGKTRVIFSGNNISESVSINNDDNQPYLIQAGIIEKIGGELSPHFIVTPPISRLENKSTASLRLLLKDPQGLPRDKESLFYLNVKMIPSTKKEEGELTHSKLVLITNFVIKVIYRPEAITNPTNEDYQQVLVKKQHEKWFLDNPTPYYLTVTSIKINQQAQNKTLLLAPYSHTEIATTEIKQASWHVINDYGELSKEFKYKGQL